jgi:hypothetical protein
MGLLQASTETRYNLHARGEVDMKGKGSMFTWWLSRGRLDTTPNAPTEQAISILEPIQSGTDLNLLDFTRDLSHGVAGGRRATGRGVLPPHLHANAHLSHTL